MVNFKLRSEISEDWMFRMLRARIDTMLCAYACSLGKRPDRPSALSKVSIYNWHTPQRFQYNAFHPSYTENDAFSKVSTFRNQSWKCRFSIVLAWTILVFAVLIMTTALPWTKDIMWKLFIYLLIYLFNCLFIYLMSCLIYIVWLDWSRPIVWTIGKNA